MVCNMENKIDMKKTVINSIYFFCVICILALTAYSIYAYHAFWEGLWHGSYLLFMSPLVFSTYTAVILSIGAFPMLWLSRYFIICNGIAKNKEDSAKGLLISLPVFAVAILIVVVSGIIAIPLLWLSIFFLIYSGIVKSRCTFRKALLISLPVCICFFNLVILSFEIVLAWGMYSF